MIRMLLLFFLCFIPSFSILYIFSGGIWGKPPKSPLLVAENREQAPITRWEFGQREIDLYGEHKVKKGSYIRYKKPKPGQTSQQLLQKNLEIYFSEMRPWSKDKVLLRKPLCIYFPEKQIEKWKTPDIFVITAQKVKVQKKDSDSFETLQLEEQVIIKGYGDPAFVENDFTCIDELVRLLQQKTPIARYLVAHFSVATQQLLKSKSIDCNVLKLAFTKDFNVILRDRNFFSKQRFPDKQNELYPLLHKHGKGKTLMLFNRILLSAAYPQLLPSHILTTVTTDALTIKLEKRKMTTAAPVRLQHGEDIAVRGTGLQGRLSLEKLVLKRNVQVKIGEHAWQQPNSRQQNMGEIHSKSLGPTELQYLRAKNLIRILQQEQVVVTSKKAQLSANKTLLLLSRMPTTAGRDKWQIRKFTAWKDVHFRDGQHQGNQVRGDFVQMDNEGRGQRLLIRGTPNIVIDNLGDFTILPATTRDRMQKQQRRLKMQTLHVACQERIEWQRKPRTDSATFVDCFRFYQKVHLRQIATDNAILTLKCERAQLLLHGSVGKPNSTLMPEVFVAQDNVHLTHPQIDARGTKLHWRRIDDANSKIVLQGQPPELWIKKLQSGDSNLFAEAFPVESPAQTATPTKKTQEDMRVTSTRPMVLHIEQPRGASRRTYRYQTKGKAYLQRYRSGTPIQIGNFCGHRLAVTVREFLRRQNQERFVVRYFTAENNITFRDQQTRGGGKRLLFNERQQMMQLIGDAWAQGKEGRLSADRFRFDMQKKVFSASGETVKIKSKAMGAVGRELYYDQQTRAMTMIGKPATLWQFAKNDAGKITTRYKHKLYAHKICYQRDTGCASATGNAILEFSVGKDEQLQFAQAWQQQEASNSDRKSTPEEQSRYRLKARELTAKFASQQQQVTSFEATGGIAIEKLLQQSQTKVEKIFGQTIVYANKRAQLLGDSDQPARVFYQGNEVISPKFTLYEDEKRVECQGPCQMSLVRNDALYQDSKTNEQPNHNRVYINCSGIVNFLHQQNRIEFRDNVKVRLKEGILQCEHLQVLLAKQALQAIIAHRNVKLTAQDSVAYAEQLYWNESAGMASLSSPQGVTLHSSQFKLTSPVIWYHIGEKRFITQGKGVSLERLPD